MNVRSNRRYVIAIVLLGIGYFLSYSSQEWFLFRVHKDAHGMLMNVGFQWVAVLPLCSGILLCMGYATALATFFKKPVRASFPLLTSSLLLTLPYIVQFMDLYGLCFRLTGTDSLAWELKTLYTLVSGGLFIIALILENRRSLFVEIAAGCIGLGMIRLFCCENTWYFYVCLGTILFILMMERTGVLQKIDRAQESEPVRHWHGTEILELPLKEDTSRLKPILFFTVSMILLGLVCVFLDLDVYDVLAFDLLFHKAWAFVFSTGIAILIYHLFKQWLYLHVLLPIYLKEDCGFVEGVGLVRKEGRDGWKPFIRIQPEDVEKIYTIRWVMHMLYMLFFEVFQFILPSPFLITISMVLAILAMIDAIHMKIDGWKREQEETDTVIFV